ncbi:MAG: HAMP domain-containing sensor histidine kinase [Rubripirellula sp.]|nr:HAMP domain-containing sensor histidine kinase [Rubripirellula sp.]
MRLAAKLILLFLIGLLLIVGLFAYLTIQTNQRLAIDEHERYAKDLAATIQSTMQDRGIPSQDISRYLNRSRGVVQHVQVRWVELNGGSQSRPTVPTELILARREVTTFGMPDQSGQPFLYTYVPVFGESESPAGRIEVAAPDTASAGRMRQSMITSLVALIGVATLSGIVIWVGGVNMVGKPLNHLIDKVHRVGNGDFDDPIAIHGGDELGRLGSALNEMCQQLSAQREHLQTETASRLEAEEQLRHADRLNSVGRMAAGIAHEIGTPLNVVIGRAQLIQRSEHATDQVRSDAEVIHSEADRIAGIVRGLLGFTHARKSELIIQPINQLLASTVEWLQPMAKKHHAQLSLEISSEPLTVKLDSAQMQQVWTNLILNAIQATNDDGRVEVVARASGETVQISFSDNGSGMKPEDQEHVFEPFFTTKDVGEGTGLGLSISHGIVKEHGGEIRFDSTLGEGSCFHVILPLAELPEGRSQSNLGEPS